MPVPENKKLAQHGVSRLSDGERLELSLLLLKELKPLQKMAVERGYSFLSYLLEMVVLETQSLACGTDETDTTHCVICGSWSDPGHPDNLDHNNLIN